MDKASRVSTAKLRKSRCMKGLCIIFQPPQGLENGTLSILPCVCIPRSPASAGKDYMFNLPRLYRKNRHSRGRFAVTMVSGAVLDGDGSQRAAEPRIREVWGARLRTVPSRDASPMPMTSRMERQGMSVSARSTVKGMSVLML